MNIVEYTNENAKQYNEDLKYWCNGLGELHHHGEYDITEEELPEELRRAYDELWTCGSSSLCYLVEYMGEYYIALLNEFDDCYANDINSTMEALYQHMKSKAEEFAVMEEFKTAQILIAEEMGCNDCHEFFVLLPCDTEKELFDKVEKILSEKLYI